MNRNTRKPVANARRRPTPTLPLSPVSVPYRERKWIEIEPRKLSHSCFEVPKFMIRSLRHDDSVHREEDGAVRFDDLAALFKPSFSAISNWPIQAWMSFLAKGRGQKKRFQYSLNPHSSEHFLYFRAIQGLSGGTLAYPTVQNNVLLRDDFASTSTTSRTLTTCTPSSSVD